MQLVKTTRDNLLRPLQTVSGIVERRHTLPILANVLIRKNGDNVSFLSTDLEIQITTPADFGAGGDLSPPRSPRASCSTSCAPCRPGDVTLDPAEQAPDACRAARAASRCRRCAADEFPPVNEAADFGASLQRAAEDAEAVCSTWSISRWPQQDIRYYLNGMLLVLDGNNVIAVATDGHRLAFAQVEARDEILERQEVIIPRKTMLELQRLLEDIDETARDATSPPTR